ncbi:MAG: acylphosphatase [Desulfovibrionales bacterium]
MIQTYHGVVRGRVQGVFFRSWTREQAQDLGLTGWVQNRADGSVEVVAQGSRDTLETFEQKLHQGPAAARVDSVEGSISQGDESFDGFEIRR